MSIENAKKLIKVSSTYIININRSLKSIKLDIMANFICIDNKDIVISTNNVTSPSNLQEIKRCIKSSLCTDADQIDSPRLLQSKSYLKIVSIPYLSEQSNTWLSSEEVERILKSNHIFNNIVLASKPRVIKISSKLDISIIWINIWDMQSSTKAKSLINRRLSGIVHTGDGSLQDELRDVQTYGITLASAYILCHLSAAWLQFQMIRRSLRWK